MRCSSHLTYPHYLSKLQRLQGVDLTRRGCGGSRGARSSPSPPRRRRAQPGGLDRRQALRLADGDHRPARRRSSPSSGSPSPGSAGSGSSVRSSSSASSRCSTSRSAWTRPTRPTASSSSSSRTATTAGAPTSSSRSSTRGSSSPAGCGRAATSRVVESIGLALTMGGRRRDRDQHRPRARPQARQLRALAQPRRPRPDRLRPLLHRAQPRPPRQSRHPRGPGQLPPGGELLGLPAAHRHRQPALGLGDRDRPPRPHGQVALDAPQRHPQRLGDDGRPLRRC